MNLIAHNIALRTYVNELSRLLPPSAGFHFNVARARPSQFSEFSSMKMASTFEGQCPTVWRLFGALLNVVAIQQEALSANERGDYLTEIAYRDKADKPSIPMPDLSASDAALDTNADMPDEDWGMHIDEDLIEDERQALRITEGSQGQNARIRSTHTGAPWQKPLGKALEKQIERTYVRRLTLFSLCMNNSNMRCNTLQAVVGMFAHTNNTSDSVIEFLSHAGLSVAPSSINRMVDQMSSEAQALLKTELLNLVSAMGLDNVEVRFDTEQPTPENPGQLVSMTSAAFFPLRPGTIKEDLRVCEEIWARSEFNPYRSLPPVVFSHDRLMSMIQKVSFAPEDEMSMHSLFAWHVRDILLSEDLETIPQDLKTLFRRECLGLPAQRSSIPHTKTKQRPMRTMDISLSTTHGSATAMENILRQGGAVREQLQAHVVLMSADLGAIEKYLSLQESRAIEDDAWDRLQFLVFLPGWFHIRMALADAMHRLWIFPERSRAGHPTHPHSLFHLCTLLRPREIGKISTNPGLHGVDLKDWRPTWEQVVSVSREVVSEHVAALSYRPTRRSGQGGDMVHDQIRLFNQNALLYLSVTRAARYGDVRRVRHLLPMWVYIWRQTGKHKYARHITRFLRYLDGGWPAKLSEVVQQNWLVNPTGKVDGFRGVDWVIERYNYFQKRQYSGSGSNRTPEHLQKESVLIEDYQAVHRIMEHNFYLTPRTTLHPPPVMKTSLNMVRRYLEGERMCSHHMGRTFLSAPTNAFAEGIEAETEEPGSLWSATEDEEDSTENSAGIQLGDLAVED
ncbi:hypothetical protein RhiJN_06891 [Ceratobasidium sp. AG-Ba]|nr:hypothetical protein RhiJN_06891 [Ceratobasidium sp. AG-Ba]QRW07799.1 hypothetical protein RhiLY_06798 [Ceratobasidium sp. AG-Ba]